MLNVGDFEVKKVTKLYIAFTGTHVDPMRVDLDDYLECNHLISGENGDNVDEKDVAIIQLRNKSKDVPENAFIFNIPEKDVLGHEMPKDRKVTLIGFNRGTGYQNLEKQDGLHPQMSPGELNNLSEEYRVGYSIPTRGGSSGSPVVNEKGQLVAIHNSSVGEDVDFRFGIRPKYLKELFDQIQNKENK